MGEETTSVHPGTLFHQNTNICESPLASACKTFYNDVILNLDEAVRRVSHTYAGMSLINLRKGRHLVTQGFAKFLVGGVIQLSIDDFPSSIFHLGGIVRKNKRDS